jgi:hypothetical protein
MQQSWHALQPSMLLTNEHLTCMSRRFPHVSGPTQKRSLHVVGAVVGDGEGTGVGTPIGDVQHP